MSHYRRYPAYKDSGVEWLGEVPEHWQITSLKRAVVLQRGHDLPDTDRRTGNVPVVSSAGVIGTHDIAMARAPGVVTGRYGSIGQFTFVEEDYWPLNTALFSVEFHKNEPRYIWYLLQSLSDLFILYSTKSAIPGIDRNDVHLIDVAFPERSEQHTIAAMLDSETARIDALIAKKVHFIKLLKEKRQALITRAVTKGLAPTVKMKDSGVEWIGEVPGHWRVERLATLYREAIRPGDPQLPVLSISIHDGISDEELAPEDRERQVYQIEDRTKYKRVKPNDLAYNMMRAWQGAFGAVQVEGLVSPAYVVAEPCGDINSAYVEQVLRTPMAVEEMRRYSRGIADFRMRLYWEYFRDLKVCIPSVAEQETILSAITVATTRIDSLTAKTEHSITLLKERRAALITAAVTGQIDLRKETA